MKRALLVGTLGVALAGACGIPSFDEYAGGSSPDPSDGATPETSTPVADAGPDASPGGFRSCAEIHAAIPAAGDGYFTTISGEVYCDMTTAGGGWTLIARSDGQGSGDEDFGWKQERGSARDESEPYCLPVLKRDVPFTEVLVGERTDEGKGWTRAYLLKLSREALLAAPTSNVPVSSVTTAVGNCNPPGGPAMLHNAGFTDLERYFHFRDLPMLSTGDPYGFFDDGMFVNNDECELGGNIHQDDGMLMVR